jgi:hypothetical protein
MLKNIARSDENCVRSDLQEKEQGRLEPNSTPVPEIMPFTNREDVLAQYIDSRDQPEKQQMMTRNRREAMEEVHNPTMTADSQCESKRQCARANRKDKGF